MPNVFQDQTFWTVVGTVVALFAIIAQILSPTLYRARKTLSYRVLYDGPPNREMQANGQAITTENARLVDIRLENHGTIDVERSHYERPITFSFGTAAKVLYAEVLEEEPAGITASLEMLPDRAQLNPVLLNKGDSIRLVVFLSDAKRGDIKVDGRIVGVTRIVDRTPKSVRETYVRSAAVLLGALLIMILAAAAETLGWLSIDIGLLSYLSVGLAGGLVTFSLVFLLIERRTKDKRREFASRVLKAFRRHLPERGSLRFRVSNFNWESGPNEPAYTFSIAGFNERAEDIEVRDVDVVFLRGNEQVAKDRPRDPLTGYRIDHLNFPSREWRVWDVEAGDIRYSREEAQEAVECDQVQLVMRYADGEEFRFEVPVGEVSEAAMVVKDTRRWRPLGAMLVMLGTVVTGIGLEARSDPVAFLGLIVLLLNLAPAAWSKVKGTPR